MVLGVRSRAGAEEARNYRGRSPEGRVGGKGFRMK
jgi:hypothetical protein